MESTQLYEHSFKSEATKLTYTNALDKMQKDLKFKDLQTITKNPKQLQQTLIEYVCNLRDKGKSRSIQNISISAIQKWCEVYDIEGVNWKKIRGYMRESKHVQDRLYSIEEIRKMSDGASIRTKSIILTLVSSGMRVGALPDLRLKHIHKTDIGIYRINVYADSNERYVTFLTPEATEALDTYLTWRKTRGETITPDSPLYRLAFTEETANSPKPITRTAIVLDLSDLTRNLGIRTPVKNSRDRKEMPLTHSFRKFAYSAFIKSGMKSLFAELLLGHNVGLAKNYARFTDDEIMNEYLKATDLLTISDEPRLQKQVENLKRQNETIEGMYQMQYRKIIDWLIRNSNANNIEINRLADIDRHLSPSGNQTNTTEFLDAVISTEKPYQEGSIQATRQPPKKKRSKPRK